MQVDVLWIPRNRLSKVQICFILPLILTTSSRGPMQSLKPCRHISVMQCYERQEFSSLIHPSSYFLDIHATFCNQFMHAQQCDTDVVKGAVGSYRVNKLSLLVHLLDRSSDQAHVRCKTLSFSSLFTLPASPARIVPFSVHVLVWFLPAYQPQGCRVGQGALRRWAGPRV